MDCKTCFELLKEKNIISKTAASYILTQSEKKTLLQLESSIKDIDVLYCINMILHENKCSPFSFTYLTDAPTANLFENMTISEISNLIDADRKLYNELYNSNRFANSREIINRKMATCETGEGYRLIDEYEIDIATNHRSISDMTYIKMHENGVYFLQLTDEQLNLPFVYCDKIVLELPGDSYEIVSNKTYITLKQILEKVIEDNLANPGARHIEGVQREGNVFKMLRLS